MKQKKKSAPKSTQSSKPTFLRIFVLIMVAILFLGFVIFPLVS